jgi:hypothetical protein
MAASSSSWAEVPQYPVFSTQTPELKAQIAEAIAALPAAHRLRPVQNETFATPEEAYTRLKDWGFTQGISLVKESANNKKGRWRIDCSRHHKETRNSRRLGVEDKQRLDTHSEAFGCKFALYISQRKNLNGQWAIGWTKYQHHNH